MDYEDGFNYLVQRYESSALIPGLIDELLQLTPATTDKQAYENLTQLISTTSMIQSYDQIDKLDSNCRNKLISILLSRELQIHFLKDQTIFEEGLRKELCPDMPLLDTMSEASCMNTSEIEIRRRTWWLAKMTTYTTIIREIVRRSTSSPNKRQSFASSKDQDCPVCEEPHMDKYNEPILSMSRCRAFRKLDPIVRLSIVDQHFRCHRCLKPKDACKSQNCSQHIKCFKCNSFKHHPLLHVDVKENEDESSKEDSNESCNED